MKMTDHTNTAANMVTSAVAPAATAVKPNIMKDAMKGLMTSICVGVLASIVFALVILFLSSNALANVPDNQYLSCKMHPVQVHQGFPLFLARNKGDVFDAWREAGTDYFLYEDTEFSVNQVNSSRPYIQTAHLIGRGHEAAVLARWTMPLTVTFPNVDY